MQQGNQSLSNDVVFCNITRPQSAKVLPTLLKKEQHHPNSSKHT
jgi:hypothetical protein